MEEWLVLCSLVNYEVSPLRKSSRFTVALLLVIIMSPEMQETGNIDLRNQYTTHLNLTVYKFKNMKFKNALLSLNVFHKIRFKLFDIFDKKSRSILAKPKLYRLDYLI